MSQWTWPLPGYTEKNITSRVGPRGDSVHNGIDIAAPKGTPVVAAGLGRVIDTYALCNHEGFIGDKCGGGYGNRIYIDHLNGYVTRYAHLSSVDVRVGDLVTAGRVIGKVGNTGNSTGNHLHFEIRKDGNIVDPENYVRSSRVTVINESTLPENRDVARSTPSIDESVDTIYEYLSNNPSLVSSTVADIVTATPSLRGNVPTSQSVPYDPESVTNLTARDFTGGMPIHAFYKILIGSHELAYEHGKPNLNQAFEINRLDDAGCTAQFTIFDDNWLDVEQNLADNWNNITMIYGYSTGLVSPEYKMILMDYSIDFMATGVILSVKAISEGIVQNVQPVSSLDTLTKNPTEAIKNICKYMGWEVVDSNFELSLDVDREETYKLLNDNPVTYINDVIIPEAQTQNGEILGFYLSANASKTAHLKVKSYGVNTRKTESNTDDIPTYIYQKGYDSNVLSLSFNINGVFGGMDFKQDPGVATGLAGNIINPVDKQEYSVKQDQSTVTTVSTGNYSHTLSTQSIPRYSTAGETLSQLNNRLYYHVKSSTSNAYEATMVILGDPRIQLFEDVRIINLTEFGGLHHTSGIYLVKGIVDSVENGEYRSTLQLIRSGDINSGVELRSPKQVVN